MVYPLSSYCNCIVFYFCFLILFSPAFSWRCGVLLAPVWFVCNKTFTPFPRPLSSFLVSAFRKKTVHFNVKKINYVETFWKFVAMCFHYLWMLWIPNVILHTAARNMWRYVGVLGGRGLGDGHVCKFFFVFYYWKSSSMHSNFIVMRYSL